MGSFLVFPFSFEFLHPPGTSKSREKYPKAPQKLPKWSPKSPWKVKKSRFWEEVKTFQNHGRGNGLATCSLCAEVDFPKKIVKKTRQESSPQLLHKKLEKVTHMVPKWSPRGAQSHPFDDSCRLSFFIWGPFGVLGRPWGARVAKMIPRASKWSPGAPKSDGWGTLGASK